MVIRSRRKLFQPASLNEERFMTFELGDLGSGERMLRKRRNETAVKCLKTNDRAKRLIQR